MKPTRLGVVVQLCALPWVGFVPDDLTAAPVAVVRRLAGRFEGRPRCPCRLWRVDERTRTEHLRDVLARLGWRTAEGSDVRALEDFVAERAMDG